MDIAMSLEQLIPSAQYFGSVTDGTSKAWDAVTWNDDRKKPSWKELLAVQSESASLTQDEARERLRINQQLVALDLASLRPMRAILRGNPSPDNQTRLDELGDKAQVLRTRLREISE